MTPLVVLLSMGGMPLTLGFYPKWGLISVVLSTGVGLTWAVIIFLSFCVIRYFYVYLVVHFFYLKAECQSNQLGASSSFRPVGPAQVGVYILALCGLLAVLPR